MNVYRVLEVRDGDVVSTLREFMAEWWDYYQPDVLLAPVESADRRGFRPKVINNPAELAGINPFAPVMQENAALAASRLIHDHAGEQVAVMLRPCELRAFVELRKRQREMESQDNVTVIGVDCLGTFTQADYRRHIDLRGPDDVTAEVLSNAAEGGLRPQRFRTACQICDWPAPRGADMTIGTIGVASNKHLLLIANDEKTDSNLGLNSLTDHLANEYQASRRETVVGAIADARTGLRKSMIEDMQGVCRFDDLGCILAWFANCSLCGECLKACPIYDNEFADLVNQAGALKVDRPPLKDLVSLSRWLASCAGCGMCEEECAMDVPLVLLISALSHRIREKMHYRSGDPAQRLPWVSG